MSLKPPTAAELRVFRAEFKLSQAAFAEKIGFSTRAVEEWERKDDKIPPVVGLAIAYYRDHPEKLGPVSANLAADMRRLVSAKPAKVSLKLPTNAKLKAPD